MRVIASTTLALILVGTASQMAQAAPFSGHVQDASGRPIAHAYVRQPQGTAVAFTDAEGNFALAVDPKAERTIMISADGFEPVAVNLVRESPQATLLPVPPVTVPQLAPATAPSRPGPLTGSFGLRYDERYQGVSFNGNAVNGPINNELGCDFRVRTGSWLWMLDAFRNRAAVSLADVTPSGGTTFSPETVESSLALGYVLGAHSLEYAPYVSGLYRSVQTGTSGAAYSGTPLDDDQSRSALGIGVMAASRLGAGFTGTADLHAYPLAATALSNVPASAQLTGMWGASAALGVGYRIVPGLRLELGYRYDLWRAAVGSSQYAENTGAWMLGISSYPAEVSP